MTTANRPCSEARYKPSNRTARLPASDILRRARSSHKKGFALTTHEKTLKTHTRKTSHFRFRNNINPGRIGALLHLQSTSPIRKNRRRTAKIFPSTMETRTPWRTSANRHIRTAWNSRLLLPTAIRRKIQQVRHTRSIAKEFRRRYQGHNMPRRLRWKRSHLPISPIIK